MHNTHINSTHTHSTQNLGTHICGTLIHWVVGRILVARAIEGIA